MKFHKTPLALAVALLAIASSASAADNFTIVATSGGTTVTRGFDTALNSVDSIKGANLASYFPSYTTTSAANIDMNYRGLPMNLNYAAGSQTLVFSVPSLGITQNYFDPANPTRDGSQAQFKEALKTGSLLNQIQKRLAEVSPIDPIAGNPNSLMSQMVANDFSNAFTSTASNIAMQPAKGESINNLIGVGLRFGSYKQGDFNSQSLTIPLSYTIRSNIDPRRQLIFSLPISHTTVQGAKAYYVGGGVAYRFPVNDNWTLTPSFSYAVTGAPDLGSAASVASGSISSTYVMNFPGYDIAIGNMIGFYKTMKFSAGGYSFDPGISNTVFRNGIMYSQPITLMGKKMSIEYSLIDTRFTGSALYTKGYNEIGVTVGTNKSASSARSYLRGGLSYLFSPQSKGFTLNLGYWF